MDLHAERTQMKATYFAFIWGASENDARTGKILRAFVVRALEASRGLQYLGQGLTVFRHTERSVTKCARSRHKRTLVERTIEFITQTC